MSEQEAKNVRGESIENDPRRFFAAAKSEIKEFKLEDLLLELSKNYILQLALQHDLKMQRESIIDIKSRTYGGLVALAVLLVFLGILLVFVLLGWKVVAIIWAAILLVVLLLSTMNRMSKNSVEKKIGYLILGKVYKNKEINFKDEKLLKEIDELEQKGEELVDEFQEKTKDTTYIKQIPTEHQNLFAINRLYELARSKAADTVNGTYEVLEQELEQEKEKEQEEQEQKEH